VRFRMFSKARRSSWSPIWDRNVPVRYPGPTPVSDMLLRAPDVGGRRSHHVHVPIARLYAPLYGPCCETEKRPKIGKNYYEA